MTTREEVLAEAREWIDTRWAHQAMVKGLACDCAGLVLGVGDNAGALAMSLDDPALTEFVGYSRQPNPGQMIKALSMLMVKIRKEEAGAGDVVYRKYGKNPQHLAILTGRLTDPMSGVIHALAWPSRKVVEHRTDEDWYMNVISAWRYPGLEV